MWHTFDEIGEVERHKMSFMLPIALVLRANEKYGDVWIQLNELFEEMALFAVGPGRTYLKLMTSVMGMQRPSVRYQEMARRHHEITPSSIQLCQSLFPEKNYCFVFVTPAKERGETLCQANANAIVSFDHPPPKKKQMIGKNKDAPKRSFRASLDRCRTLPCDRPSTYLR